MKAQKGIRVLIVEDESLVAEVVQALLERSGYVVVGRAAEGVRAVEMTQSLRPDVVLMDIALPGMDGLEATRRIYKACPTPVVVLSAYDMPELVELASAVGVGAYLVKPPRARELERAITISIARFGDLVTLRRLNAELYAEVAERKRAEEAQRESEERYRLLVELSPDAIVIHREGKFVFVNPAAAKFFGASDKELIGKPILDVVHPDYREIAMERIQRATQAQGEAPRMEEKFIRSDGTVLDGEVAAVPFTLQGKPATLAIIRDISRRKRAERSLERRVAQLALLSEVGSKIAAVLELEHVLDTAARLVQECFGYHHVALFTVNPDHGELKMRARAGQYADSFPPVHQIELGRGMVGWVGLHGERLLANDVRAEPRYVNYYPGEIPTQSELAVPIRVGEENVGVLDVQSPQLDAFDESDVMVIETLADQIAVAIENARLYEVVQKDLAERKQTEESLRESEQKLKTLFELLPVGVSVLDAENKIAYVNPALEKILDITRAGLLRGDYGKRTYLRPDGAHMSADEFASSRAIREQRAVHNVETGVMKEDGQVVWVNVSAAPGTFPDWRVIIVTDDITERKRADERIRREAARAGALARVASILNAQLDLDKVLDAVCSETARALNVPATSVTLYDPDRSVLSLVSAFGLPPEISERFAPMPRSLYDEYALRGDPFIIVPDVEAARGRPHGSRTLSVHRNFRMAAAASLMREGQLIGTLNIHVVGEQRVFDENELALLKGLTDEAAQAIANAQLFEQVTQQREQLRALAARLAEAEEAERRRLARELHDQVGQTLTALGINLNIVRAQMPGESSDAVRSRLEDSLALVEQTTERVRSVMAELRPPVLDDYGLVAALRWYGAQFSARTGLAVEVRGEELTPRLAAPVESALFRITQEAINNVVKHARATQMTVTVESDGEIARLVVADDGIGFARSVAQRAAPSEHGGWGVMSMSERAEAVGGHCCIESRPGQGTRVVVEVSR